VPGLLPILKRILLAAVAGFCLLYAGDYALLRYHIYNPKAGDAFGAVKIQPTYAIPHKDGKSEFVFGDPVTQTCVHSLFSHLSCSPCWRLARQSSPTIPMTILPIPASPSSRPF
jgi:hypothetical protein